VLRKILLFISTLGIICIAFAIYAWHDQPAGRRRQPIPDTSSLPGPETPEEPTTRRARVNRKALRYSWANVPSGYAPKIRVYDQQTGLAKIVFQARQWDPISDTEFHLVEPSARVLLPGGQLAYVRADEGQVKVQAGDNKNLNPKRGWFKGHVQIFIDRTTPQQRSRNPELAAPETHPEAIVKIWMDEARFDLDLARLDSNGPILVQSAQGSIEGTGLQLVWSEVDRRLQFLRIVQGKRAIIRGAGLDRFGPMPGTFEFVAEEPSSEADTQEPALVPEPRQANKRTAESPAPNPQKPQDRTATAENPPVDQSRTSRQRGIVLLNPNRKTPKLRKDRVDSYHVQFSGNVLARQRQGIRVTGSLAAEVLTLLCDFGRAEREAVEYTSGSRSRPAGPDTQPGSTLSASASNRPNSYLELLWTGEVVVRPASPPATQATQESPARSPRKRFHVIAEGKPVRLVDARRGEVTCGRLEYHLETRQGWLTASPGHPVVMSAGPDRELVAQKELFFDQKARLAKVIGPGRLLRHEKNASERLPPNPAGTQPATELVSLPGVGEAGDVQIAWQRSARIDFDLADVPPADEAQSAAKERTKKIAYLSRASFEGDVSIDLPDRRVAAETLHVTFMPPDPRAARKASQPTSTDINPLGGKLIAQRIIAAGRVRMDQHTRPTSALVTEQRTDHFTCGWLEIDMTVNDVGENVPRQIRAYDDIVARQTSQRRLGPILAGQAFVREIRAGQRLILEMASFPRTYTPEQRARFEQALRERGLTPDSEQWQEAERRYQRKRDTVATRLQAEGGVFVRDTKQNLGRLEGQQLECTFTREGDIHRALVVGQPHEPAHVVHKDFEIRGRQISLNMSDESVRVPGEGLLRFYTDQDIDGRPVDRPIPVAVTWTEEMWLRGGDNKGSFSGRVRVVSENNVMESDELRLRFEPVRSPEAASFAASGAPLERRLRRRLVRVDAFGHAVILSSAYAEPHTSRTGRFVRTIRELVPDFLQPPVTQPAHAATQPVPARLESRIRLAGPQIRIDLEEEQLIVEGAGNLLIEDYRLPAATTERRANRTSSFTSASAVPGLDSVGPSQTLFTWQSAMTFLNKDNIAKFDQDVVMRHRAGADMVLAGRLRAALQLDEAIARRLRNQTAMLTCDTLLAQFERDPHAGKETPSPLSRATRLKAFWARGNPVTLVHREGNVQRSATGVLIAYDGISGIARIEGSPGQPNVIQEVDPATGRLIAQRRGGRLEWNLKTQVITADGSIILAPGR